VSSTGSTVLTSSEQFALALSAEDIAAIDAAGALGEKKVNMKTILKRVVVGAIACTAVFGACNFLGISMM
jgi:hypothetical protein